MKRFVVAILALVYLTTTIGVTMHLHYCMGKVASWGMGNQEPKTCSECGMEKSEQKDSGCCKDKYTFLKNKTDQKVTESSFQMKQLMAAGIPASFTEIPSLTLPSVTEENPISHAPSLNHGIPIYILNCIYRI
jgi:hypothetical protein